MSSYVAMLIADPRRRLVVASHYIGGNQTAYKAHEVLNRVPDHSDPGFESWGKVTPEEMHEIIEQRYVDGLSPETLTIWEEQYPPERYLWCLTRDY
jgi:hypothetical protein